jgi:probable HAF family extracellular repeat protein
MRHLMRLVATACSLAGLHAAQAAPEYRVTVLSSAGASGNSVNDLGLVGGSVTLPSGAIHATLWEFGQQRDLGTLGSPALSSRVQWPVKNIVGLVSGIALTDKLDPNKEGWSCGFFLPNANFNQCLGFVWDPLDKRMRALPTLGGTNGFATGTNNLGQTVGWAENTVRDSTCVFPQVLQFKPVVWGPGRDEIQPLPLVSGDSSGAATAVNDRGQVVGISGQCGFAVGGPTGAHAVLWDNGVLIQIHTPQEEQAPWWNTPMMINERGDVVGFYGVPNDPGGALTPPFFWNRKDGFRPIPLLSGDIAGAATSVNRDGQVVGYSNDASGNEHPWIWDRKTNTVRNLNDLIEPGSALTSPITLAFDINDRGEITGTTSAPPAIPGQAFVLTPIHRN